jgi:predicted sulfurtransferase
VVLYYKFVTIAQEDVDGVAAWFSQLCSSLSLLGRVRVALNGINVTVGHAHTLGHVEVMRFATIPLFYVQFYVSRG